MATSEKNKNNEALNILVLQVFRSIIQNTRKSIIKTALIKNNFREVRK